MECFIGTEQQLLELRVFLGVPQTIVGSPLYCSLGIFQCLFNLLYFVFWWLQQSATPTNYRNFRSGTCKIYPASRTYLFTMCTGVWEVTFTDNCPIFYRRVLRSRWINFSWLSLWMKMGFTTIWKHKLLLKIDRKSLTFRLKSCYKPLFLAGNIRLAVDQADTINKPAC